MPSSASLEAQESFHFVKDMGRGLGSFMDRFLCGRDNHYLFHTCLGLGALEIGLPNESGKGVPWTLPLAVVNNKGIFSRSYWEEAQANPFPGIGMQHPPIYDQSISDKLSLPDWNYNDGAHMLCIANGFYDTGRKFFELWNDPKLHHNVAAIVTGKQFLHTGLPHALAITVMTLLHPFGALIAIPMGHLCGQMLLSALRILSGDKQELENAYDSPMMHAIHKEAGTFEKFGSLQPKPDTRIERMQPAALVIPDAPSMARSSA